VSKTVYRARHREQRSALAPIASFAAQAGSNVAQVGRRSAVVALSTGLVAIASTVPASAAEQRTDLNSVDVASFVDQARNLAQAAPVVTVASDVKWTAETHTIKVTPAPEPVVVRTTERAASRTSQRAAISDSGSSTTTSSTAKKETANKVVPSSVNGNAVLEIAARYVGVPYVYGGSTPKGFDCSGFTSYVYAQLGISLPRSSGAQRNAGTVIPRSQAQPGDLIWTPGHVAIYAGGNQQIDAPRPGKTIQFRSIWQSNPTFIRLG